MRLDRATGEITCRDGVRIGPRTSRERLARHHEAVGGRWAEAADDGGWWTCRLVFAGGRYASWLTLVHHPVDERERPGDWSDWSLAGEQARRARHDTWVRAQLGSWWFHVRREPYAEGWRWWLPWGFVESGFQHQNAESVVVVRWSNPLAAEAAGG